MTQLNQVYKCMVCGNIVEVLHNGAGELVCCGQPMLLMQENTEDATQEKHVPVIEKKESGVLVKVGEVPHPMEDSHFIEWIEVLSNGKVFRKNLEPTDLPEAFFEILDDSFEVRAYCNLHGLWTSQV